MGKTVYVKNCKKCGMKFSTTVKHQKYCGEDCAKKVMLERQAQRRAVYRQLEEEQSEQKKVKKRSEYTVEEWNSLKASERWERMTLREVDEENLKYHIPSYGKSQTMARMGQLPTGYGKQLAVRG